MQAIKRGCHLKNDKASLSASGSLFYPYVCTQGPHTAPCPPDT